MAKQRNPKGMGSYRQLENGTYQWRQRIDGKERYLTASTPKELQEKVKEIADLPIIKEKFKVDDWFNKWLKVYIEPLKSKATYEQYSTIYKAHIKPEIGSRKMATIKPYDVQAVIATMNKNGMSSWTMKHARKIMNGAFTKAFKDKVLPVNPVQDIEIPKKQAKTRKALTTDELIKLFKSLESSRWIWSVKFMLVTGIRRGELLALRWTDIDFDNKRITIDESNSSTGLNDVKNRKVHYVPLSKKAVDYLEGQKRMLENEVNPILHDEELKKTALIFPNQSGHMLMPRSYYTMLTRAAAKVGIKATPHCLRHTFVYMNRKTLSLKELQSILGHDESTTTLDIYGDMINESTDETAKQIDSVFDKLDEAIIKAEVEEEKKMGKIIQVAFGKAK